MSRILYVEDGCAIEAPGEYEATIEWQRGQIDYEERQLLQEAMRTPRPARATVARRQRAAAAPVVQLTLSPAAMRDPYEYPATIAAARRST